MHPRQVPVKDDHVIGRRPGTVEGGLTVMDDVDRHPGIAQTFGDPGGQGDVILDHEHSHRSMMPGPG